MVTNSEYFTWIGGSLMWGLAALIHPVRTDRKQVHEARTARRPLSHPITGCCAPAASGHADGLASNVMKSRRRIAAPKAQACAENALD